MAKKTYWEKLKDPRWQKLRLEAMQANEFTCEMCGDSESTLNVHHKEYFKGHDPWEYEVSQLSVLCEECHEEQHEFDFLKWVCSYARLFGPGNREELAFVIGGFLEIPYDDLLSKSGLSSTTYYRSIHKLSSEVSEMGVAISIAEHNEKIKGKKFEE